MKNGGGQFWTKRNDMFLRLLPVAAMFFVLSAGAFAQVLPSYLFLEVKDSADLPIAGAEVRMNDGAMSEHLTDSNGAAKILLYDSVPQGKDSAFTITKGGFYEFRDFGGLIGRYDKTVRKIELLKIPKNPAQRAVIGNEQDKRDFLWAAKTGDAATVGRLLKSGLSPDLKTSDLRGLPYRDMKPAVIFAAESGDGATLTLFVKAGAKLNEEYGLLHDLVLKYLENQPANAAEAVEFENGLKTLVAAGGDIFARGNREETSLGIAAKKSNLSIVRFLLAKGLKINEPDYDGVTPLMNAIDASHVSRTPNIPLIAFLLNNGADPNAVNRGGNFCRTALCFAAWQSSDEVMDLLIAKKADVNFADEAGETALSRAVYFGEVRAVGKLLALGADVTGPKGDFAYKRAKEMAERDAEIQRRSDYVVASAKTSAEIYRLINAERQKKTREP